MFNGIFILLSCFCVFPLLLIVSASFTSENRLALDGYRLWPKEFSLEAFSYILRSPRQILTSYGVTITVTLVGTLFGLIATSMLAYVIMPWHVFLMKGFFADIPMSLVEAGKIDRASEIYTFFHIIIPVSKPAFATIGLFYGLYLLE